MPIPTEFHGRLKNRVAIVTGAGSQGDGIGTGKAIAYQCALEGATVCLVDNHRERAEAALEMITSAGGEAFIACGDVTDPADVDEIVKSTVRRCGFVDLVVNNLGVSMGGSSIEAIDPDMWDRVMALNVKSAMLMLRASIPHFPKAGGSIVNISSVAGIAASGSCGSYGPSKAALIAFTREIASRYGRQGIRANVVIPGHIVTPMVHEYLLTNPGLREQRRKIAPLGFEGDAWDIAAAVTFLACDESRFITGAALPVDGGLLISMPTRSYELAVEDEDCV